MAMPPPPATFGNGIPLAELRKQTIATNLTDFHTRYGRAFLLVQVADVAADAASDTSKTNATDPFPRTPSATNPGIQTSAMGPSPSAHSFQAPPRTPMNAPSLQVPPSVVFALVRRPGSQFDWIAVGRNDNNDVFLPHASVSR